MPSSHSRSYLCLVRDEKDHQLPIYYVSKVLFAVEARYPKMEKLALSHSNGFLKIMAIVSGTHHTSANQVPSQACVVEA